MKYGIVRGAPATASVPCSESDEDTNNNCSSSIAALYNGIFLHIDHKLPFPSLDVAGVTLFRYKPCLEPVPAL